MWSPRVNRGTRKNNHNCEECRNARCFCMFLVDSLPNRFPFVGLWWACAGDPALEKSRTETATLPPV